MARLRGECEMAKRALSANTTATIKQLIVSMKARILMFKSVGLVSRNYAVIYLRTALEPVERVLADAKMSKGQIMTLY
jgi:molecular chaperone DnaK (HSP70)